MAATGVYAQSTVELYGRAEVTTELGKRQSLTSSTTTAAGVTTRNGTASVNSDNQFFSIGAVGAGAAAFMGAAPAAVMNNKPSFAVNDGNTTGDGSSRIGFRGTEDLGGGLKAVFQMEAGVNIDDGSSGNGGGNLFSRTAIVGLEGGFGRVTAGRQVNPAFSVQAQGSAMGAMNGYTDAGLAVMPVTVRSSNSIMYTTPDFGGLKASALVSAAEAKGTSRARLNTFAGPTVALLNDGTIRNTDSVVAEVDNNDKVGYSLGLNYASGPLYLGVGYDRRGQASSADVFATGADLFSMNAKQELWTLSAAYDFGVVRPFINYSQQTNKWNGNFTPAFGAPFALGAAMAGKEKAWALGLTAPVGTGTLFAEYGTSKTGSISDTVTAAGVTVNGLLNQELSGKETAFSLGYRYPMSKRTWVQAAYGSYKQTATLRSTVNAAKVEDVTKSSGLALTLSHAF